jgi:hypothetical protein
MTKDCGCGEKSAEQRASQKSTSSTSSQASQSDGKTRTYADVQAQPLTEGTGAGVNVGGPISRLNPADGLFLKAVHLDGMQKYSAALSNALGIALGTGVVYGFELKLEDELLIATEGLAITLAGRALQSSTGLILPLEGDYLPTLLANQFWLIVLEPAEERAGSENAYGTVCAEPCEGIGTIQPWIDSLVRLRLQALTMDGLDGIHDSKRRSWLASQYFERERNRSNPWTVPRAKAAGVPPLLGNPWHDGGVAPTEAAVPIGVLQKTDKGFVLDTWTARRELSGPPGAVRWAGHLAMRPWSVFLAQVLQFEDQFKSENDARGKPVQAEGIPRQPVVTPRDKIVEDFFSSVEGTSVDDLKNFKEFQASWREAEGCYKLLADGLGLVDLGFVELPPAGYLGGILDGDQGRDQVEYFFDDLVSLRFCDVRADYVAGAIRAAQHLDRIPLDRDTNPLPEVDILVPKIPADLEALKADSYGWVAFVRRSPISCDEEPKEPDQTDSLEIFSSFAEVNESLELLETGSMPEVQPFLAVAMYAKDTAQLLQPPPDAPDLSGLTQLAVVGVAPTAAEESRTGQRARSLIKTWQLDPEEATTVVGNFLRPFIVIFVRPIIG